MVLLNFPPNKQFLSSQVLWLIDSLFYCPVNDRILFYLRVAVKKWCWVLKNGKIIWAKSLVGMSLSSEVSSLSD